MARRDDTSRRIFLRYAITNLLILALPLLMAALSYRISLGVIQRDIDSIAVAQLQRSMTEIERTLADLQKMSIQLSDDYQVNFYLANPGPFTGVELYNLKRLSEKISSYVLSNTLLGHCFLFLEKSGYLVYESGFASYNDFYGTLFAAEGYTAEQWHAQVLRSPDGELFLSRQAIRMGGQRSVRHLYRRSIGYGSYHLGSIVGIIDAAALDRMLADLPRRYGGWAFVQDAGGRLIGSTNPDLDQVADVRDSAGVSERIAWRGETYRLYRRASDLNGWEYTAVLSETKVFAGVGTFRNTAYVLLGIAFAGGLGAAYLFAFTNARPLRRLFSLALGEQGARGGRLPSVYEQVEQAIVLLSDSNRRLEREARSAAWIGTTYFFQNLLRGTYRSRAEFEEQRQLFHIEFPDRPCYVVLCRLASLNAAGEGETYPLLREALLGAAARQTGASDFVVPVSFDDVAVIRSRDEARPFHEDAASFVQGVRSFIEQAIRGSVFFGIGTPTADPFLLLLSHQEAATAVSSLTMEGREAFLFYEDMPKQTTSYYYPLDVEASIMKAVRAANADLLDSLLHTIRHENHVARRLSPLENRNLFIELQGTLIRLLNELPSEQRPPSQDPPPEGIDGLAAPFHALIEIYDRGKRSHNSELLRSVQAYLGEHFARADLGLTVIADVFRISENYLSNFYKEQTGEGLSAAIHRIRFDEAVRLLLETDETIDAIALKCGYLNSSSFRRAFKQRLGLSPSAFKQSRSAGSGAGR